MQHTRKAEGRRGKVSRDDLKFIGGSGGRYLSQIKESLMIQKLNPELNGSVTSVPILFLFRYAKNVRCASTEDDRSY